MKIYYIYLSQFFFLQENNLCVNKCLCYLINIFNKTPLIAWTTNKKDFLISPNQQYFIKMSLVDYFPRTVKSAAVAVYSAPEKLNDDNTRLEEKLVLENIFET
jgi:hypothetical protein